MESANQVPNSWLKHGACFQFQLNTFYVFLLLTEHIVLIELEYKYFRLKYVFSKKVVWY